MTGLWVVLIALGVTYGLILVVILTAALHGRRTRKRTPTNVIHTASPLDVRAGEHVTINGRTYTVTGVDGAHLAVRIQE